MTPRWEADRLRAIRKKTGLTQEQVADRAGIARVTYNKIEKGNRTLTAYYRQKIAPVIRCDPDDLRPPEETGEPEDPLRRLAEAEDAVAANLENLDALQDGLEEIRTGIEARLNDLDSRVRALEE